jgi:hypothetical protein
MWDLKGMLLYRSIEHRNEGFNQPQLRIEEDFTPYGEIIRDPRVNPEAAKKIAA